MRWVVRILELAYYAGLAALVLGRSAIHPGRYKFGPNAVSSDSLQAIYDYWLRGGSGRAWLGDGRNPLLGAPLGEPLQPLATIHHLVGSGLAPLVGPVAAYNLLVLGSLAFAGWLTHRLALWLTGEPVTALVIGTAFATTPYAIAHGADHVGLAQVWVFPLFFGALFRHARSPDWPHAGWLAAATALPMWVHGYYGVFTLVLVAVIVPVLALHHVRTHVAAPRRAAAQVACIGGVAAANAALWLVGSGALVVGDPGVGVAPTLLRPIEDLQRFGIRGYEFLMPPYYGSLAGPRVLSFLAEHDHGSSETESTLYLGAVPMLVVACAGAVRLRRRLGGRRASARESHVPVPRVIWGLLFALIVMPIAFAIPPEVPLGSAVLEMPSEALYRLAPTLRAICRWGIVAIFAFACVAAIHLADGLRRLPSRARWAAGACLVGLVLVDQLPPRRSFSLDTSIVPSWYEAVRALPGDPLILDLPYWNGVNAMPLFWQTYHGKRLFNSNRLDHPHFREQRMTYLWSLEQRDFARVIEQAGRDGVDFVLLQTPDPPPFGAPFSAPAAPDAIVLFRHAVLIEIR